MKLKFILLNVLFIMFCITLLFFNNIFSQNRQAILNRNYPLSELKKILISVHDWHPYPASQERDSWKALPEEVRQGLISRGEKYLHYQWPVLPASLFLDFTRTGNRENFQKPRSARREALCGLVLAECAEGKGRFINDIVNGIWAICEESYWGVPVHLSLQA